MRGRHLPCRKSLLAAPAATTLIALSAGFLLFVSPAIGQSREVQLRPGRPATGLLRPGESHDYLLPLKEGQYAEIRLENRPTDIDLQLLTLDSAPVDGVLEVGGDEILSFTAERTATYRLRVYRESESVPAAVQRAQQVLGVTEARSDSKRSALRFRLTYTSTFVLPPGLPLAERKRINDYDIRIYKARDGKAAAFVILENGRQVYAKRDNGRFNDSFSFDVLSDEADKASADLVKPGRDITGTGLPGLMIGEYTGGAHCCFILYTFELGPTLHIIPSLDIGNTDHIGVKSLGVRKGVAIVWYDDSFAYWNASFADSPMPEVILRYRDGAYRPDFELMRKPAPSRDELGAAAKQDRAALAATAKDPYLEEDTSNSLPPFWGRMLDLIYTGHEDLAWKYLDEVWPPQKEGKNLFARDFKKQLSESRYWKVRNYKGS